MLLIYCWWQLFPDIDAHLLPGKLPVDTRQLVELNAAPSRGECDEVECGAPAAQLSLQIRVVADRLLCHISQRSRRGSHHATSFKTEGEEDPGEEGSRLLKAKA